MTPADPTARTEPPASPAAGAAGPHRVHESYWLSSLELRRGMEVEVLGMRHVPGEVLREFLRMHRTWEERASRPPTPRAGPALDIAFEADGSVTIPGDLRTGT